MNKVTLFAMLSIFLLSFGSATDITTFDVEHISLITTPVYLLKRDSVLSMGTGFYYIYQDEKNNQLIFLVTNYHVLTGYEPSKSGVHSGDKIVFYVHKDRSNVDDVRQIIHPLFTKEKKPVWITNDDYPNADVAIIPLPHFVFSDYTVFGISESWADSDMKIRPTSVVSLIGYPHGYHDTINRLPVWKTGNIASEPRVDFNAEPLFVVDVSAFPGMSGSPVFAIAYGTYEKASGGTQGGGARQFLGIYASMERKDEEKLVKNLEVAEKIGIVLSKSLELGHVWKAKLIIEMIKKVDISRYEREIFRNIE